MVQHFDEDGIAIVNQFMRHFPSFTPFHMDYEIHAIAKNEINKNLVDLQNAYQRYLNRGNIYHAWFIDRFHDFMVSKHGFLSYEDQKYIFTNKGRKMQSAGGVVQYFNKKNEHKRQERESRILQADLAKSNLLMVDFARKQYIANFFIAVATCLVGAYTLFQMFDYYENHYLDRKSLIYFLSGLILGLLLWLVSTQLKKILAKPKH